MAAKIVLWAHFQGSEYGQDMPKAFDKVPHEKLLYKLEVVGVRGPLLAWFRSFLTNRRHRTVIEYASD